MKNKYTVTLYLANRDDITLSHQIIEGNSYAEVVKNWRKKNFDELRTISFTRDNKGIIVNVSQISYIEIQREGD